MTTLLDSSVAIALLATDHQDHDAAERWFANWRDAFATCPITQGAVVRYVIRHGRSTSGALAALRSLVNTERHEFWPDDIDYTRVRFDGVVGHRQVTDAYLAQLARDRGARLATFDRGFAELHDDVTDLVPA